MGGARKADWEGQGLMSKLWRERKGSEIDRQTERQKDRKTDRQTDRKTDREREKIDGLAQANDGETSWSCSCLARSGTF